MRFGVLQAGNYGVSQSRKRAFIWVAAPDEILPEWPEPMHVYASSQLKISLPGGLSYAAVHDAGKGAPLRAMTVKDTIYDLPPVVNGASKEDIKVLTVSFMLLLILKCACSSGMCKGSTILEVLTLQNCTLWNDMNIYPSQY